ncbi:MAG: sulfite exporter TauE/SafE family protein [Gemmatimonadaceae bacterium]
MTLVLLIIGIAAGVLSGLFGIGGGIIIVPALMYGAKMDTQRAVGTSLGALLLPVGVLGAFAYYKTGHVDVRASLLLAAGLAVGAFFGAQISLHMDSTALRKAFAVFLVLVAGKVWFS